MGDPPLTASTSGDVLDIPVWYVSYGANSVPRAEVEAVVKSCLEDRQ